MWRTFSKFRTFLTFVAVIFSLGQPFAARAETVWQANADDALLFDVRLGQYRLGDGVRGYQAPSGVCLDFADVILALDLQIRLDKKLRRATGWVFEERRTILIDREANTVQNMNNREKLDGDSIRDTPEGWCVDSAKLAQWLGVTLTPDTGNALLFVKSDTKLPVELAAERRARAAKVRPAAVFDLKTLNQADAPFRGVRPPAIDVVVTTSGQRQNGKKAQLDLGYELFAAGEVGPVAYDARLASSRRGVPDSLRIRAYRTDPDGGLLGPLKATEVAVGDVSGASSPLVAQTSIGRGALLTNRPIERAENFDRTNFRGDLPNGWDAELYRNGQLLAFAIDRSDGRYEFLDVPLLYGQNRFEVVLYGPQGQIRRETKSVTVGANSIPPKATYYWAGFNQDGRDLIGLGSGVRFGSGRLRGSFGVERGIDAKTSIAMAGHTLFVRGVGRRNFYEANVRRAIGTSLLEVSGTTDFRGGFAARAQVLGEVAGTYFNAETINVTGGFRSDRITENVRGIHSLTADRSIRIGRTIVPVSFLGKYTVRSQGSDTLALDSRISANLGRFTLTGELDWQQEKIKFGRDPPGVLQTSILANARFGRVRLRGEARFRLRPDSRFDNATLVAEWSGRGRGRHESNWRAEIGYDQYLHRARGGIGYVRRYDKFSVTTSVEAATDGSVAAGLNLAFSLGPDPRRGRGLRLTSSRLASHGQTLARVFRDTNGDGVRQSDEPYQPEVQLAAGQTPIEQLTDANGEVIIEDLQTFRPVLIGIDVASLPDPLIQPASPGIVVTPRPGVTIAIDLPLVSAGEVDGTLVKDGGAPLEGVDLELVNAKGTVTSRTRSDFDGFFIFESVPYGNYFVRVSELSAGAARISTGLANDVKVDDAVPSRHLGTVVARADTTRTAAGD